MHGPLVGPLRWEQRWTTVENPLRALMKQRTAAGAAVDHGRKSTARTSLDAAATHADFHDDSWASGPLRQRRERRQPSCFAIALGFENCRSCSGVMSHSLLFFSLLVTLSAGLCWSSSVQGVCQSETVSSFSFGIVFHPPSQPFSAKSSATLA